jgi:hypothetical protein
VKSSKEPKRKSPSPSNEPLKESPKKSLLNLLLWMNKEGLLEGGIFEPDKMNSENKEKLISEEDRIFKENLKKEKAIIKDAEKKLLRIWQERQKQNLPQK